MGVEIVHDRCSAKFSAVADGKEVGELTYTVDGGVMNIFHTFVDPESRGRGIGTMMTDAAEAFARTEGLKTVATCSYAASKLRK